VMTKIGEAFLYSKAAFLAPADKPLLPMSKVVKGASGDLRSAAGLCSGFVLACPTAIVCRQLGQRRFWPP